MRICMHEGLIWTPIVAMPCNYTDANYHLMHTAQITVGREWTVYRISSNKRRVRINAGPLL